MTAVEEFAQHIAGLDEAERDRAMRQVRMMSMNAAPDEAFEPPALQSGEDWAATLGMRLAGVRSILEDLGYMDNVLRLLDQDDNAEACRKAAVRAVTAELLVSEDTATDLILGVTSGVTGDAEVVTLTGDIVPTEFLTAGRWYEGKLHLLFGREGTNKTTLLLNDACALATENKHSILFEYEMDANAIKQMIDDLGYDRAEMDKYVHIVCPREQFSSGVLLRFLGRWPEAELIVLDNVSEAIASGDGSENESMDVIRTLGMLRNVAHDRGIGAVALDHLPHHRNDAARGSTAKAQIMDVAFSVEALPPVRRDRAGKLKLVCRKDRPSLIGKGAETWLSIGDGEGGLPIAPMAETERAKLSDTQVEIVSALQSYAEAHPVDPKLSGKSVLKLVGITGGRRYTDGVSELQALASDPSEPVEAEVVKHGAQERWTYWYSEVPNDDGLEL